MSKQLSASSVARAMLCSFPFRPDVRTVEETSGTSARLGTAVHSALESHLLGRSFDWSGHEFEKDGPRHVAQAVKWLAGYERVEHVERGIVYNARTDTAEWGPRRGEDGYEATPPWCIRGTLDMGWSEHTLRICDLKTGKEKDYSMQLRTLGLAVARITGRTEVTVGALYTRLTKSIPPKWEVLDEDALDAHAGVLHRLLRRLPVAEQNAGDQCVYCAVHPEDCLFRARTPDYETEYEQGDTAA